MGDLQKMEIEHRVRLALLRNRGVIKDTIEDFERTYGIRLKDDYVIRIYRKFRREVRRDNLRWVSYHFAQEFISQAAQIQNQLTEQLKEYNERSVKRLSVCCRSIVRPHPYKEGKWLCVKCDQQCETYEDMDMPMERLKLKVIEKMQHEQDLTMRFLQGMGFLESPHARKSLDVNAHEEPKTLPPTERTPQLPSDIDPFLKKELDSIDPRDAQLFLDGGSMELEVEFEEDRNADSGTEKTK
jgi:hypothetical protein